jgi:hypothetical protein
MRLAALLLALLVVVRDASAVEQSEGERGSLRAAVAVKATCAKLGGDCQADSDCCSGHKCNGQRSPFGSMLVKWCGL